MTPVPSLLPIALVLAFPAHAQLIGPDSTLQGSPVDFRGSACRPGLTWINGGCGFTSSECTLSTPGSQVVTALVDGSVWGSNSHGYTVNSDLSTAVVHAGLLTKGQSARIEIKALDKKIGFPATTAAGVTSSASSAASCAMTLSVAGPITHPALPSCRAMSQTWVQRRTSPWNGNRTTLGNYYCSAWLGGATDGNTSTASVDSRDETRRGSAVFSCVDGQWTLASGWCEGKEKAATMPSGYPWMLAAPFDGEPIHWIAEHVYRLGLFRGMAYDDVEYYRGLLRAGQSKESILRRIQLENPEYRDAQAFGHITPGSELTVCGDARFVYSHGAQWLPVNLNRCFSRPD